MSVKLLNREIARVFDEVRTYAWHIHWLLVRHANITPRANTESFVRDETATVSISHIFFTCCCFFTSKYNITFYVTTKDIYKQKNSYLKEKSRNIIKCRDVGRDLFYLSSEITALEIAAVFVTEMCQYVLLSRVYFNNTNYFLFILWPHPVLLLLTVMLYVAR